MQDVRLQTDAVKIWKTLKHSSTHLVQSIVGSSCLHTGDAAAFNFRGVLLKEHMSEFFVALWMLGALTTEKGMVYGRAASKYL